MLYYKHNKERNKTKMKSYLFCDYDSGEDFIVEANNAKEALDTARLYFADPSRPEEISAYEAESMGLDTY